MTGRGGGNCQGPGGDGDTPSVSPAALGCVNLGREGRGGPPGRVPGGQTATAQRWPRPAPPLSQASGQQLWGKLHPGLRGAFARLGDRPVLCSTLSRPLSDTPPQRDPGSGCWRPGHPFRALQGQPSAGTRGGGAGQGAVGLGAESSTESGCSPASSWRPSPPAAWPRKTPGAPLLGDLVCVCVLGSREEGGVHQDSHWEGLLSSSSLFSSYCLRIFGAEKGWGLRIAMPTAPLGKQ